MLFHNVVKYFTAWDNGSINISASSSIVDKWGVDGSIRVHIGRGHIWQCGIDKGRVCVGLSLSVGSNSQHQLETLIVDV